MMKRTLAYATLGFAVVVTAAAFVVMAMRPGRFYQSDPAGTPTPQAAQPCASAAGPTGDYCYPPTHRRGDAILPRSTRAQPNQSYAFEVGHCGLTWIVDFDGNFWRVARWDTSEPPSVLINGEIGKIRLLDSGEAQYTSKRGERVTLERLEGPLVPDMCA